jgi:hypothetical protein
MQSDNFEFWPAGTVKHRAKMPKFPDLKRQISPEPQFFICPKIQHINSIFYHASTAPKKTKKGFILDKITMEIWLN